MFEELRSRPLACCFISTPINQPSEDFMKSFSAFAAPLTIAVLFACAGSAIAQEPPQKSDSILTNPAGLTLYTFDKDTGGKSACTGPCAQIWPPLLAKEGASA